MSKILTEISLNKKIFKPVIYGLQGTELNDKEKYFFSKNSAIGFILFKRNIIDKQQLQNLTKSLRELMEGEILILIDQEGGRVSRMQPPHWDAYPSAKYFADLYIQNQELARNTIYENFKKIAFDLNEVGINVDCVPLLDIATTKTHEIIGDRALGTSCDQIVDLAFQTCKALLDNNIFPVIKHIPGHGRAMADSHLELPIVDTDIETLKKTDFLPFKNLNDQKFAMTAHILYKAIDSKNCATISKNAIDLIRNDIGFQNILMTDDLSMKALSLDFATRTKKALDAGCDLILHCNGDINEMNAINSALPIINDNFWQRFTK